jgi:hypothetical protein
MSTMLPSVASISRERRVRTIRRVLEEHGPLFSADQLRIVGCNCGFIVPRTVMFGTAAHRDHLAARLVDA